MTFFLNGSAAGPSGLQPSHLRKAVECPAPDQGNSLVATLTKSCWGGLTPTLHFSHLASATLLTSKERKKDTDLYWLERCCVAWFPNALHQLPRMQLPVSLILFSLVLTSKGARGCKATIHSVHQFMSSVPPGKHWSFLVDFENVFNNISHEAMFQELHQHLQGILCTTTSTPQDSHRQELWQTQKDQGDHHQVNKVMISLVLLDLPSLSIPL